MRQHSWHLRRIGQGVYANGLQKLAQFIKITGQLLQAKVYLFWGKPERAWSRVFTLSCRREELSKVYA